MIQGTASVAVQGDQRSREDDLPALMVRYQQGDAEAVEDLVHRLSPRLLRFLAVFEHFQSDAEDLLQECWIRIHKSRHTYRSPEPVLPWVFAIARHTRLDGYRRRRRRESREILVANPPETASAVPPAPGGDSREFDRLLASLPESQREVILMLKVSGMSLEEVARATCSTVGSVKQKAHRAYAKLRLVLSKEEK
jgi:RNA polymerase sigma-70 factor (ECF subfamily)